MEVPSPSMETPTGIAVVAGTAMAATGSTRCDPPCGPEVACRNFGNGSSLCVCPHDASPPTPDGKCPQRRTVIHIKSKSHYKYEIVLKGT
ncbi:Tyrosine-protein kinase transmembrane receptor Ror [Gryllus bimaculatus]|nr:Tyrosine-protein kinase transmembrane receptor Ror [Gryllus bimaculatus]